MVSYVFVPITNSIDKSIVITNSVRNSRLPNLLHTGPGAWLTEQTTQYEQSNKPGQHQNSSNKQQTSTIKKCLMLC